MAGRLEEHAAGLRCTLRESEPVATALLEDCVAQSAQQHMVGRPILGVQLQPVPLEVLNSVIAPILATLKELLAGRIAEDRQAAVGLPVGFERAAQRVL